MATGKQQYVTVVICGCSAKRGGPPSVCSSSPCCQSPAGGTLVPDLEPPAPLGPSPSAPGTSATDCMGEGEGVSKTHCS